MKYLIPLVLVGAVVWLYRTVAVGRTLPRTMAEQRRQAFSAMAPRYRQTQSANRWRLRVARKLRKSA